MANTAILEDTIRREERREERRIADEQEHRNRISENYRRLLYEGGETTSAPEAQAFSPAPAATATATLERVPVMPVHESVSAPVAQPTASVAAPAPVAEPTANTAQRLADYVAYAPAPGKRTLFDNLVYKDGELIDLSAPAVAPAPVQAPVAPAPAPAPAPVHTEEDAVPTRRTMEVLRRDTEMTAQTSMTPFAAISLKTKLVLCAIAAAIVLIIALICVNTGILSSANAAIIIKENELRDLQTEYAQMAEEIEHIESPEYINSWAEQNGMVRGN